MKLQRCAHVAVVVIAITYLVNSVPVSHYWQEAGRHWQELGGGSIGLDANAVASKTITLPDQTGYIQWSTQPPEVAPPKDHPPLTIVAGQHLVKVHYTTGKYLRLNKCDAFTNWNEHGSSMWFSSDLNGRDSRVLMMHELEHVALLAAGGLNRYYSNEDGHNFIYPTAPVLLQILRDNPKLIAWLSEQ